ncbi:MAG: acyl-CoA dehydrogenase, partial [Magnetococcales bacterium]|nr:acyl-CoA dehydrogenase [Magnetococcales bacterium]
MEFTTVAVLLYLLVAILVLGYLRARFLLWSLAALGALALPWALTGTVTPAVAAWSVIWLGASLLFGVRPIRRIVITGPVLELFRRVLPPLSQTEREALEAGTVWWDRELFSGRPDWRQ